MHGGKSYPHFEDKMSFSGPFLEFFDEMPGSKKSPHLLHVVVLRSLTTIIKVQIQSYKKGHRVTSGWIVKGPNFFFMNPKQKQRDISYLFHHTHVKHFKIGRAHV